LARHYLFVDGSHHAHPSFPLAGIQTYQFLQANNSLQHLTPVVKSLWFDLGFRLITEFNGCLLLITDNYTTYHYSQSRNNYSTFQIFLVCSIFTYPLPSYGLQ
jgi:hypothetical protein